MLLEKMNCKLLSNALTLFARLTWATWTQLFLAGSPNEKKRFKSKVEGSFIFVFTFSKIKMEQNGLFLFLLTGCLLFLIVLIQHLMIWAEDLEMCAFIFAGAFSKL